MPFVKVNKSSAWSLWQQGLIAGINAGLGDEPQQLTTNLGVNKGFNVIRLFLASAASGYSLVPGDFMDIGVSYAGAPTSGSSGWNQTTLTRSSEFYSEGPSESLKTIAQVAERITSILDRCAAVGMGVVLTVDCWATNGNRMWANTGADVEGESLAGSPTPTTAAAVQQGLVDFWRATAAKWGSHPAVVGYDILNEPDPAVQSDWTTLATRVANSIRTVDSATPIVVEGAAFGTASGLAAFGSGHPLVTGWASNKIVFSFHAYHPVGMTHGGLAEWAYEQMGVPYPVTGSVLVYGTGGAPNTLRSILTAQDLIDTYYAPAVTFKQTYGAPMFVGEFSYVNQSGIDYGEQSELFYQPDASSYSRQVTSIEVSSGKLTLVMGNIEMREYADRTGLGFRIDVSDKTQATLANEGVTAGNVNGNLENTVCVALRGLYPDPAPSEEYKALNPDQWITDQETLAALSNEERDLNARVWTLSAAIDEQLGPNAEVTIARGDHRYEFDMDTTGLTAIASGTPVELDGQLVSLPAVGLVYLSPTVGHLDAVPGSRLTYALHILNMCQSHGFSWSWHSVSSEPGRHWWMASPEIYALLRYAAIGRRLPTSLNV